MNNLFDTLLFIALFMLFFIFLTKYSSAQQVGNCNPPSAMIDLDINNVKAGLMNGGDMWWDLVGNAKYEVPKGGGVHSLFASALWLGGIDNKGILKS